MHRHFVVVINVIPHFSSFSNFSYYFSYSLFVSIFRRLSQESTINAHKGRQTLCCFRQPNDLYGGAETSGKNPLTTTTIPSLNRLIQKGRREELTKLFASFEPNACNAKASSCPLSTEHWAQTCGRYRCRSRHRRHFCGRVRKSEWQSCTSKSHTETRTVTTNRAAPNCNYHRHQRKTHSNKSATNTSTSQCNQTHSSCDDHCDCINNTIDTTKPEWYIRLASNCYRNGFQLHVNRLDEWSKHPTLVQRKPTPLLAGLRLPSSALQPIRASEKACVSQIHNQSISGICGLADDTSNIITVPPIRVACEQINSNSTKNKSDAKNVLNDCVAKQKVRRSHRQRLDDNTGDTKRIYVKNLLEPSDTHHSNRSIDDSSKLPIIDTERIVEQRQQKGREQLQHISHIEQFNTPNAKNTMNSVAIDANIHLQPTTNRQLSCQAIQINYHNNNLTFGEFYAGAQQSEPHSIASEDSIALIAGVADDVAATAANIANPAGPTSASILNNNHHHHHHWLHEPNSNAYVPAIPTQSIVTRPAATNDIDVDDLIESFRTTLDVTDPIQRHKLPQIVLSDFSNNQLLLSSSSPPTTPLLAFSIHATHTTLSEQPEQLQELQQFFVANR